MSLPVECTVLLFVMMSWEVWLLMYLSPHGKIARLLCYNVVACASCMH